MISRTADYALRALLVLARHGHSMRADAIAEAIGAPRNYLGKTLYALARAGLLTSARGPLGGFTLVESPSAITVAHVVDLFDEPHHSPLCLLGATPCNPSAPCAAHQRWIAMATARRAPYATTTIADLLGAA